MFKQNDRVKYKINGGENFVGEGIVVGVSTSAMPVIGATYIIQDVSGNFPSESYPYTHFACFECWMEKI